MNFATFSQRSHVSFSFIVTYRICIVQHMGNIPVHEARDSDGHTNLNLFKDTDGEMMVSRAMIL